MRTCILSTGILKVIALIFPSIVTSVVIKKSTMKPVDVDFILYPILAVTQA